jgi:hypothetical protein
LNQQSKNNQGKFHLAAIFLIPAFLVIVFLSNNWLYPILFSVFAFVILKITFNKSKQ